MRPGLKPPVHPLISTFKKASSMSIIKKGIIKDYPPSAKQMKKMEKNAERQKGTKTKWRQRTRHAAGYKASTEIKEGLFFAIIQAINYISTTQFRLFDRPDNHAMIFDERKGNCLVVLFQFTPFSVMTINQKDNLDFLASFFHDHKKYVNPVSNFNSACLRGKMNMMGWRKCMKPDERVGLYLSQAKINNNVDGFDSVLADHAFTKNHNIMVENHMPGFGDPNILNSLDNNFNASSSISYTYDGFYNTPHTYNRDASEFAYVQWIPTFSRTGKVANRHVDGFDLTGGEFILPDCRFGLGFNNLDGLESDGLNTKTVKVFNNIKTQPDAYEGLHDGNLDCIKNTVQQQKTRK
ncbi:hypothetical protein MJO28_008747 [Puccinia striiformis f. sp. tritici]|uniref:Uncharacterized protein n=1 Tax=Puccinia striiformis f. sp. tritici TaxID=168172 RepID=A0ACC0EDJ7_9BASI|nr:hypothetical protein MJO28_008747 [Puccinia striiformis f. sp. tritici]